MQLITLSDMEGFLVAERIYQKPETRNQKPETRPILGYDPLFDIQAYQDLTLQKNHISPEDFARRKAQLDMRTRVNLETMLGERFNVEVSKVTYEIKNNQLINTQHDEPFIEIIRRGQRYRESLRSSTHLERKDKKYLPLPFRMQHKIHFSVPGEQTVNSSDSRRELAEVEGFEKVQKILTNPQSEGAKIIVISPRGKEGSTYQHNFFDVYEKKGGIVTMTRYTSCATYEQFRQIAENLDPFNELPQNPHDADFLKNPLITYKSIEGILTLFPPDAEIITQKDLEKIIAVCSQIILNYVNNPSQLTFNALLNFADHTLKILKGSDPQLDYCDRPFTLRQTIAYLGSQQVRQVTAGCGPQTGFSSIANGQLSPVNYSPYSVAEFGFPSLLNNSEDISDFQCPGTKKDGTKCTYIVRYGSGIRKCPECEEEAKCG